MATVVQGDAVSAFSDEPRHPDPAHTAYGGRNEAGGDGIIAAAETNNEDNASSVDHIQEKDNTPPLTRWQKTQRHFRKWWWAYLIGGVVLLAILLPIM